VKLCKAYFEISDILFRESTGAVIYSLRPKREKNIQHLTNHLSGKETSAVDEPHGLIEEDK
jgi:hypothetical protein